MADDYAWRGAQTAGSDTTDFNERDFHVRRVLSEARTATLVRVVKAPYDKAGNPIPPGTPGPVGFVDVQPMVNQLDGYGKPIKHGTVFRLNYHRDQSGNGSFINDPVEKDIGVMVVSDRDTSIVRQTDDVANPGSGRQNDLADGTFFGCSQGGGTPKQYMAWLEKGFDMKDAFGNTLKGTADGVLINGFLIKLSGDAVTKHGTDVDTHVHTKVTTGNDNTGPPP